MDHNATCEQRIGTELQDTFETVKYLWDRYVQGLGPDHDVGDLETYGLDFAFVPEDTFSNQDEAFFRWQLSTGGPGDEFRFYARRVIKTANTVYGRRVWITEWELYRIEYVFLNWFDGATRELCCEKYSLLSEIWDTHFSKLADYAYERAQ